MKSSSDDEIQYMGWLPSNNGQKREERSLSKVRLTPHVKVEASSISSPRVAAPSTIRKGAQDSRTIDLTLDADDEDPSARLPSHLPTQGKRTAQGHSASNQSKRRRLFPSASPPTRSLAKSARNHNSSSHPPAFKSEFEDHEEFSSDDDDDEYWWGFNCSEPPKVGEDGAPVESRARDPLDLEKAWRVKMENAHVKEEGTKMTWSLLRSQRNQVGRLAEERSLAQYASFSRYHSSAQGIFFVGQNAYVKPPSLDARVSTETRHSIFDQFTWHDLPRYRRCDAGGPVSRIKRSQAIGRSLELGPDSSFCVSEVFRSSGGVNAIAQSGIHVAVASNVPKGQLEFVPPAVSKEETDDFRSENKMGSVIYWRQPLRRELDESRHSPTWSALQTHFVPTRVTKMYKVGTSEVFDTTGPKGERIRPPRGVKLEARQTDPYNHYLSCLDVKFDPTAPTNFVTASADGTVRYWRPNPDDYSIPVFNRDGERPGREVGLHHQEAIPEATWGRQVYDPKGYGDTPAKLCFKPNSSLLAVCTDWSGIIHVHDSHHPQGNHFSFPVSPATKQRGYETQMLWGHSFTRGGLFGGTDTLDDNLKGPCGVKFFDLESSTTAATYTFQEETGKCQAIALDNNRGNLVAVVSKGDESGAGDVLTMRLYDLRGGHRMITPAFQDQDRFRPIRQQAVRNLKGLVSNLSYSPDDIFLAVARDDNSVDIFDSRFLQEPVQTCEHAAGEEGSEHVYGIACMQWLAHREGSPYVLLTGGDDGAVRTWDFRRSSEDTGQIVAQLPTTIGYFHAGDTYKGERPLIVGDCDGTIYEHVERGQIDGAAYTM